MVTQKRTKNRIKLAAVLALGMATMPLNGCDAGAIMGIVQAAAPLIQQVIGQIAASNGGGSGVMGGTSLNGNGSGGTSSVFGTNDPSATNDPNDPNGGADPQVAGFDGGEDPAAGGGGLEFDNQTLADGGSGNTSADAVPGVDGANLTSSG